MLLLIDAGNSRIKWAVPAPGDAVAPDWQHAGQAETGNIGTLPQAWHGLGIRRVLISNVAGDAVGQQLRHAIHTAAGEDVVVDSFRSSLACAGMRNNYDMPAQLGSDRFASAIGARALYADQPLLIVTSGTAMTIDTVTADGMFEGGMILPGLDMMLQSLAYNTAQLPKVMDFSVKLTPFATQTTEAILSGCMLAQASVVERVYAAHMERFGATTCLLAGGAGDLLASLLQVPVNRVDNLVLTGLHVVAMQDEYMGDE